MNCRQVFNPFLPLFEYIPDGEPHVFDGRVYLFGSHDVEGGSCYCQAGNYVAYSAPVSDLSDWQYHGVIYEATQHPNGEAKYLYAPDVVRGNDGKYYLYYALDGFTTGIHVAVCDTPAGMYEYLGRLKNLDGTPFKRFILGDPAVINDGGTIRLYYGWSLSTVSARANRGHAFTPEEFKARLLGAETMMFGYTKEEILREEGGSVMGAVTCVLADDMLTVISEPKRIVPGQFLSEGTSFEGHAFYEAASIRKVDDRYYFIYSSMLSHELCYAVSDEPDRGFTYGGTIVSNGDVGFNERAEEERLNQTANNHGSIENIDGKWYVFYHRQTHSSTYSRQACAEPIQVLKDGSIPQVEMTSCGLNGGALKGEGSYPAVICCNLTNGHMPHITNRTLEADIPYITNHGEERFITNISQGTAIGYKYFAFDASVSLTLTFRGSAAGRFHVLGKQGKLTEIPVSPSADWQEVTSFLPVSGVTGLYLLYEGEGRADLLKLTFGGSCRKEALNV